MALTNEDVQHWLKLSVPDEPLQLVVPAVNAFVDSLQLPGVSVTAADGTVTTEWTDTTRLGALMLAARLHRRRNSPGGVEAITESGAAFVARYDSDISRLLQLDGFTRPAVG